MTYSPRTRGFSLVELSVTLLIIGLLVAGITAGSGLIANMRIQKTIKELQSVRTSITDFVEMRHYYPGDYPKAANEWTAVNGNGDWSISSAESAHVMHHLYESGHIEHTYRAGGTLAADINLKPSPLKPGVYWFHTHSADIHDRDGEAIDIAGIAATPINGGLSPNNAYLLDLKIDDGKISSGDFTASDGDDAISAGTPCFTGTGESAAYNFSVEKTVCRGHYWISEH